MRSSRCRATRLRSAQKPSGRGCSRRGFPGSATVAELRLLCLQTERAGARARGGGREASLAESALLARESRSSVSERRDGAGAATEAEQLQLPQSREARARNDGTGRAPPPSLSSGGAMTGSSGPRSAVGGAPLASWGCLTATPGKSTSCNEIDILGKSSSHRLI